MKRCDFYPDFEDNQVLTAQDLNSLKNYLEGQALRTRNKLIGAGIICGFELFDPKEAQFGIGISKGAGTTTEGWLITDEDTVYTFYKSYKDPAGYGKFLKNGSQIDLWELLTKTDGSADQDAQELKEEFLKDKAVIVYIEIRKVDLKTCTGDDCDEKGKRVDLCARKLLIGIDDLSSIIRDSLGLAANVDLDAYFNGKYRLPEISILRQCVILRKLIREKGPAIKYADIDKLYRYIIERYIGDIQKALIKAYDAYEPILKMDFQENPFEKTDILEAVYKKALGEAKAGGIQYFYDFLKDVIAAYDEFREAAFGASSVCCLDENLFPRHLMVGGAFAAQACPPSVFRQQFIPAPEIDGGCVEKARAYFKRLVVLIKSFDLPRPESKMKITPSLDGGAALGKKAIPCYYTTKKGLNRHWDHEKTTVCGSDRILSYRIDEYSTASTPKWITSPLEYCIDGYSFFRFEGHLGKKCDETVKALLEMTSEWNLPVSIIALRAFDKAEPKGLKLKCSRDLDLMYSAIREEILCLLNSEESYFADLKTGGKPGGLKGSIRGVILDGKEGVQGVKISLIYKDPFKVRIVRTAFTDGNGVFDFTDLAPGGYNIGAEYESYAYRASLQVEEGKETVIKVDLSQFKVEKGGKEFAAAPSGNAISIEGDAGKEKKAARESKEKESAIKVLSERGDDSVGSVYGNYIRYGSGDFIRYVKGLPWFKGGVDTGVIKTAYYPVQVLNKLMALEETLPDGFELFMYDKSESAHASLMETVNSYIAQIKDDLKDPNYKPDGTEQEVLAHLKRIADACCMERLKPLSDTYNKRLKEVSSLTLFGKFAQDHPALEHQAGAPRGGTFVIVCDEDSVVVADFALPYICASDCPPFAFVIPSQPVVFKLQKTAFSKKDDRDYVFIIAPDGGEVKGPGVKKGNDGLFYFKPSESQAGDVTLTYELGGQTYTLKVTVVEINPNFTFVISPPGQDWRQRQVSFTPIPEDADRYEWDFGDGFPKSQEKKPIHLFDLSAKQEFEVSLTVSKGEFAEDVKQTIKIAACTAAFTFRVASVKNKVALVEFAAEMEGGQYDWDFDDNTPHGAEQKPLHSFDVSARQAFNVRLKAGREGCSDERSQVVKIETCSAAFKVTLGAVAGNTVEAAFSSEMASADSYAWDFGDGDKTAGANEVKHTYMLKPEPQTLAASLTTTKGICSDTASVKVELPAAADLAISLEKNVFCKKDDKRYKFNLKTLGGVVTGPGVENTGGDFFFHPAKDGVNAGMVEFTYTMPDGRTSGLKAEVLDPRANFVITGIARVSEGMYKVKTENRSKGADKYLWKVNGKPVSDEASPVLPVVDAAPGQQVEIMLVAINVECEDAFKEAVAMPAAPPLGDVVIDVTHVPVTAPLEEPEAVMEVGRRGLKVNMEYLNSFKANPAFEAIGGDRQAFEKTTGYFAEVMNELGDPATARMYSNGEKDADTLKRLGALMELSFGEVKRLEAAPQEQRQFAYNLFVIQLNHLLDISELQKDIGVDSPLVRLFRIAAKILTTMKELVEIDPEKRLARMLKTALAAAQNRQVYTAVLKKLIEAAL